MRRARWQAGTRDRVRDPVFWSGVVQLLKTVLAGVLAWFVATEVFDLPQSFLAPWAALLVVHATVYRTLSGGARQVAGAVLGVLLAWAVGNLLGLDALAVAVVLTVGLVVGTHRLFGDEVGVVATTALIVLTTGFSDEHNMLLSRLLDTGIGIVVGLVVNLAVWPPLRRRTAIGALDALDDDLGDLLCDIGRGLESPYDEEDLALWDERTRQLDDNIEHAWGLVRQARESARLNPRRTAVAVRDPQSWHELLQRLEQANADLRSLTRTLAHEASSAEPWDPEFRTRFPALVLAAGHAIKDADTTAIGRVHDEIVAVATALAPQSVTNWAQHGALLVNLRNIVVAMVDVAAVNPMEQPPLPFSRAGAPRARWRSATRRPRRSRPPTR